METIWWMTENLEHEERGSKRKREVDGELRQKISSVNEVDG